MNKEYEDVFRAIEPFTLAKEEEPTPIIYSLYCKAKQLGSNEWVYGYYLFYKNLPMPACKDRHYIIDCNGVKETPINPETLCRCTCKADKSKKLILFEGDIVSLNGMRDLLEIRFEQFEWRACIGSSYSHRLEGGDKYTIVGNIYDNPELLIRYPNLTKGKII